MTENPKTLSVPAAGKIYFGVGRSRSYQLAKTGAFPTIRFGKRTFVSVSAMEKKLLKAGDELLDRPRRQVSPASIEAKNLEAAG